jgi:heterodisulfide reductase subunit A
MKVNVWFCQCGDNIAAKVNREIVEQELTRIPQVACRSVDFLCSEEGKQALALDLAESRPDRVVIAACSPREYEATFRKVLGEAGLNPYYLQMVNIREHVSWVTPEPAAATAKALRLIHAGIARVRHHEPLMVREVDANTDAVVIGAGPAGLKCARTLAEAGRHVVVVEKTPVLGGLPVRYEELFPNMECGACLLEPLLSEVMHGRYAENIELLTISEVVEVTGYQGNFIVKVRRRPRFVDAHACIGCGECIPPCPVSIPNEFDCGLGQRRAISFPFAGALPNAPFIDEGACLRAQGENCSRCVQACPVPSAILLDDHEELLERKAGAIIVATGAALYNTAKLPEFRDARRPGVYTNLEFERILAANGPTNGEFRIPEDGRIPRTVAIIHCVGSLDPEHVPYCSGVCCGAAFKLSHLAATRSPDTRFHHLYKELVLPGKEEFLVYAKVRQNPQITMERYTRIAELVPDAALGSQRIRYFKPDGSAEWLAADMVVLCPAIVPASGLANLAGTLELAMDRFGFLEEYHGRTDSSRSKLQGVYLAGGCQAPADIQRASNQGMAAAGYVLSGLVPGRRLEVDPVRARVDKTRCSGCRICPPVCPYRAITMPADDAGAEVNELLCQGCGTCVAACPAGAIRAAHFTGAQILAEMEALLQ